MCVPHSLNRHHLSVPLFRRTEQREPAVPNRLLSEEGAGMQRPLRWRTSGDWKGSHKRGRESGARASAKGESGQSEWALRTVTQTPQMTGERREWFKAWRENCSSMPGAGERRSLCGQKKVNKSLDSLQAQRLRPWKAEGGCRKRGYCQNQGGREFRTKPQSFTKSTADEGKDRMISLMGKNWFYKDYNYRKLSHLTIKTHNKLCTLYLMHIGCLKFILLQFIYGCKKYIYEWRLQIWVGTNVHLKYRVRCIEVILKCNTWIVRFWILNRKCYLKGNTSTNEKSALLVKCKSTGPNAYRNNEPDDTLRKKCLYIYALCENSPLFLVYFMMFSCGTNSASFSVHRILADICLTKYIFLPNALLDPQWLYPTELLTSVIVVQGQNPSNRVHCSECSWAKSLGPERWQVSRTEPLSPGSGRVKRESS